MDVSAVPDELTSARAVRNFIEGTEKAVRAGRLLPGETIILAQCAERLNTSPSRLRLQLRPLESEGLLTARGRERFEVAPLDTSELDEVFRLRLKLEPALLAHASAVLPKSRVNYLQGPPFGVLIPDWQDDHVYAALGRVFGELVHPAVSEVELSTVRQLQRFTERAVRIGFGALSQDNPHEIARLTAKSRVVVQVIMDRDRDRDPVLVRQLAEELLGSIREMAWYGARSGCSSTSRPGRPGTG